MSEQQPAKPYGGITVTYPDGSGDHVEGVVAAMVLHLMAHRQEIEQMSIGELVLGWNERKVWARLGRSLPPIEWRPK